MKMRERRPLSPRLLHYPEEWHCPHVGATLLRPRPEGGSPRGSEGNSGQEDRFDTSPGGPLSAAGCPKPVQSPEGRLRSESDAWRKALCSSGPRAKVPRPRAPEPGRGHPDWDYEDPGAITHGGEHSWTAPSPTDGPDEHCWTCPSRNPPGRGRPESWGPE
ncbi:hypothetical protein GWK47_021395 [Chionoecetes opilio]|uniref:Uncharacterized protein n=1 Tax=Chionoecetes opilio TaxID=41210 RepID=A0A8J5CGT8_CHIOP|nr:hypothetical protein GWK47_021395 [Chionoecetes opilio]